MCFLGQEIMTHPKWAMELSTTFGWPALQYYCLSFSQYFTTQEKEAEAHQRSSQTFLMQITVCLLEPFLSYSCTAWAIFVIAMEMWKIYQIEDIGRNLKGNTWVICVGYICCVGVVVEVTKYIEENGIEKGRWVYQILSNKTVGWDAIPMKF